MGLKAVNILIKTVAKKLPHIVPKVEIATSESIGLGIKQLTGDVVQIEKSISVSKGFNLEKSNKLKSILSEIPERLKEVKTHCPKRK